MQITYSVHLLPSDYDLARLWESKVDYCQPTGQYQHVIDSHLMNVALEIQVRSP
jgi:hypothetical protein